MHRVNRLGIPLAPGLLPGRRRVPDQHHLALEQLAARPDMVRHVQVPGHARRRADAVVRRQAGEVERPDVMGAQHGLEIGADEGRVDGLGHGGLARQGGARGGKGGARGGGVQGRGGQAREVLDVDDQGGRSVGAEGVQQGLDVGFVVRVAAGGAPVGFVLEADLVVDEDEGYV